MTVDTYCVVCGIPTSNGRFLPSLLDKDIEHLVSILNKGEFHVPSKTNNNRLLKKHEK